MLPVVYINVISHLSCSINDTIAPYTAFVKGEHKKIEQFSKELEGHTMAVSLIKEHINKAFPGRVNHTQTN